jgi:RNA polymerase sigma factor for flagellar operon FliA
MPTPEQELEQNGLKSELKSAIKELPERERLILALYYYEELTLSDIGQVIGLSESRISQILNQTHMNLKQKLGAGTRLPF